MLMMMIMGVKFLQLSLHVSVVILLLSASFAFEITCGVVASKIPCLDRERHALLMFKRGLVDNYGRLSSWGTEEKEKDCCKWRGVHCSNRTGHVVKLDLRGPYFNENFGSEPLTGTINPSLLELRHLNYLDLSYNDFEGHPIPKFIGSLSKLRYLNLSHSEFGGVIPYQLGNLPNLQFLDMSVSVPAYDHFKSLGWLSGLRSLRHLDLSGIYLGEADDWIKAINNLPLLTKLLMHECHFPDILPSSLPFVNWSTSLVVIDLSTNSISSSIYNLLFSLNASLIHINLGGNSLGGVIPDAFGNMISLEHLDLTSNELEGGIPKSFENLSKLQTMDLSSNSLNQTLSEFFKNLNGAAESIEILRLSENQLSGSLPDITRFSSLKQIYLEYNQLNGSFPKSFGRLSKLEVLELYRNQIKGSLPDLSVLSSLKKFTLYENQLSGTIPISLGHLSKLEFLDASSNFFEGKIFDTHFWNPSKLQYLDLSFNSLSLDISSDFRPPFQLDVIRLAYCKLGPNFPNWLQNQKTFSELDISFAGISATAPNWFWNLPPQLVYFNISYNQIKGVAPISSFNFTDIRNVDLSNNYLEGPIPSFPPNVSSLNLSRNRFLGPISFLWGINGGELRYLDLSDNLLSGVLPSCWMHLDGLDVLNLANNNLTGRIPTSFGSLRFIIMLHLRGNNLIGELPVSLKNLTSLIILDVGENRLSGKIPSWIGDSPAQLYILSLRSNEFYGSIPSQICHLSNIQILDLSLNNISGIIPECLENFSALTEKGSSRGAFSYGYGQPPRYRFGEQDMYGNARYVVSLFLVWKGRESEYKRTLGLVKSIDLSSNKLSGKIPTEVATLLGLVALNLSRNSLTGVIPPDIGQL